MFARDNCLPYVHLEETVTELLKYVLIIFFQTRGCLPLSDVLYCRQGLIQLSAHRDRAAAALCVSVGAQDTYLSHMCLCSRQPAPKWNTHCATAKCCVCTRVPGRRFKGWQKEPYLSRFTMKRYSENDSMTVLRFILEIYILCIIWQGG